MTTTVEGLFMRNVFEVGKVYETTRSDFYPECGLVRVGQRFTCHHVDVDGCAWSQDVAYEGVCVSDNIGWCVATSNEFLSGDVREVQA